MRKKSGGDVGIRTLETLTRLHDFQSCSFSQLGHISALVTANLLQRRNLSNILMPKMTESRKDHGHVKLVTGFDAFLIAL